MSDASAVAKKLSAAREQLRKAGQELAETLKVGDPITFVDVYGEDHTAFVRALLDNGRLDLDLTDGRRFLNVCSDAEQESSRPYWYVREGA